MTNNNNKKKNSTRIGSSLLGTWTGQTELLSDGKDNNNHNSSGDQVTAYFILHFMPDPRKAHSCALPDCPEVDNQVCELIQQEEDSHYRSGGGVGGEVKKSCLYIANEKDVSWSDLTAFFYFGVKINSPTSHPKAQFELSTGDWIGPWNLIMAQDDDDKSSAAANDNNKNNMEQRRMTLEVVDRYVSRYVQSQSIVPAFLQNIPPATCSLYNKPDDFAAFLGSSTLEHMTRVQTNVTITTINDDPYASYLQTCTHGNVQPILPQLSLDFIINNNNHNSSSNNSSSSSFNADNDGDDNNVEVNFQLQYKIMAVPTPDEQAYRVLPQLQAKFQGHGGYNIIAGPYCYENDPQRAYSFDLWFNTAAAGAATNRKNTTALYNNNNNGDDYDILNAKKYDRTTFVRGCIDGYPCVPPAAMGGLPNLPANNSCDNNNNDHHNGTGGGTGGVSNLLLSFGCYGLAVALLISITFNFHLSRQHKLAEKKSKRLERWQEDAALVSTIRGAEGAAHQGDGDEDNNNNNNLTYFGGMNILLKGGGISDVVTTTAKNHQNDDVGPFGDLDQMEGKSSDPLQEPLLNAGDNTQ